MGVKTGFLGIFKVGALLFGSPATGKALLYTNNGAPTDGTTLAGKAGPGSLLIDTTNKNQYINIGTLAAPVWLLQLGFVTVTLTNAQILALRATPITIAAAPGANKINQFLGASLNVNGTAGAYTESADNLAFKYVDGSGVTLSETIEATGFIDQAGKMITNAIPKKDVILTEAQGENAAIVLHNTGDGEYGGGNAANTMKVTLAYRAIVTL